jgi:hypothetical protein
MDSFTVKFLEMIPGVKTRMASPGLGDGFDPHRPYQPSHGLYRA